MKRTIISSILIILLATGIAWGKGPGFSGGGGASSVASVVALWASGSCSGYLKSDGTCDTPSGTLSGGAQYFIPIWTAADTLGKLASAGTAGNPLISGGAAANPSWLSIVLAGGTNTFSITNGTASLDVAAGATLNIDKSLQIATGAVVINGNAGGSSVLGLPNQTVNLTTMTNGKLCGYNSTGTAIECDKDAAGTGDFKADGTVAMTAVLPANAGLNVKNGATSAGYIDIYEDSDDGTNKIRLIAQAMAGDLTYILPSAAIARGSILKGSSTANTLDWLAIGTTGKILTTDGSDPSWSAYTVAAPGTSGNVLVSDGTNWTSSSTLSVSSITSGGIVLGDTTPDADGEIGYASNAYLWYANSEDMKWTASANMWTLDSNTGAAFTITPALTVTGTTTHSDSVTIADGKKLIFDESAADPNDADIELSATDGVFKIAAANGANNEDLTIDLDQTANTAILSSGSGLTMITTGSIALTGAVRVSAKNADYTIGTDNANEAYGGFFFNTAASTRTFTLPSAVAGMSVCIKNAQGVAQVLRLDANTGDYIVKSDGTRTSAAAEYYGCASSASCMVCVVAYDATDWHVTAERGTWTEE